MLLLGDNGGLILLLSDLASGCGSNVVSKSLPLSLVICKKLFIIVSIDLTLA